MKDRARSRTKRQLQEEIDRLQARVKKLEADLSRQRQFEEPTRELDDRYEALFQSMSNGVAIYRGTREGDDFILVDLNQAAERIEKIRKRDVVGKSVLAVFPSIDEFGLLDVLKQVWISGKPIDHPVTRYEDHRLKGWRDYFVYRLPNGDIVAVYSDETDRKSAEEALKRREELFRTITESAQDCIFIKDRHLKFTYVNPALLNLLGKKAEEVLGKTAEELYGVAAGLHLREADLRVLQGETIEEQHARPIYDEKMTFHDIRVPVKNAEGEVVGICGIARDITERIRLQNDALEVKEEYASKVMQETMKKASFGAMTDSIVLLLGESGSGKDHLARWIHDHSNRAGGPFFCLNCAAIAPELAESELFGHEKGAFTGAGSRKRGLLELAEGGTLLLNEIGELPSPMQAKLLTFLDTKSFLRVGGEKTIHVNTRLIAATHRDLEHEVEEGRFLLPLFFRINLLPIEIPPLRDRKEDLPVICHSILSTLATQMQIPSVPRLSKEDLDSLVSYNWPGNIRELRNFLERSLILSKPGTFKLAKGIFDSSTNEWSLTVKFPDKRSLRDLNSEINKSLCLEALRRSGGNKKEAADLLGISRDSIHRYIRKFGLKSEDLTP